MAAKTGNAATRQRPVARSATSKGRGASAAKVKVGVAATMGARLPELPKRTFVRIVARNRVGGLPTDDRFVLVCAIEEQRMVDGEWFGKQVYSGEEGDEFGIIVREGREIHYPAGFWRTNLGDRRIVRGEMFSVYGEERARDGDDVWEITHVTELG